MEDKIIWKGLKYNSLEYFRIKKFAKEYKVDSAVVGTYNGTNYSCKYWLRLNNNWTVKTFSILSTVNDSQKAYLVENRRGKWFINAREDKRFEGIKFIDISISPFTNSLPINYIDFKINKEEEIEVVYFDILNFKIKTSRQIYTKLSESTFKYQNLSKDFEAKVKVDQYGLIKKYPKLFKRIN